MLPIKLIFDSKINTICILFTLLYLFTSQTHAKFKVNSKTDPEIITAVVVKHFPPHYSLDENGNPQGFAIDVLEELAKKSGFIVNYIIKDNWVETAKVLKNGKADLIPNLGITKSRQADFYFSIPVEIYPISIITRIETKNIKSKEDLNNKNIGVVKFNVGGKIVKKLLIENITVYDQPENALIGLLAGHVDAIVYPKSVMLKVARESGLEYRIQIVGAPLMEIKRSIAVHKGNTQLLEKLNSAISSFLNSKRYDDIYSKWYGKPTPFWTTFRILIAAGITILLITILSGIWRYFTLIDINNSLVLSIAQRKIADINLAKSEAQLKTLIETLPDLVWLKDPDGVYLSCNHKFELLFGAKETEIIGKTDYDYVDKEMADFFREMDKQALTAGSPQTNEEEVIFASDGHKELLETIKTPMRDNNGNLIGVLGIARNITERKKSSKEIEEAKSLLENVLNSSLDLIFAKNTKLQTILANKAYAAAIGKQPNEMIGFTDIENGWNPELVKGNPDKGIRGFENDDKDALAGKKINNQYDPANVNGEIRIFDTHKLPLRDSNGEIYGVLGISRDNTDKLLALEKVKFQQKEQQQILDSLIDAVITIDEFGKIISFNKTSEILFGYKSDEVVGKSIKVLMPPNIAIEHDHFLEMYTITNKANIIGLGREIKGLRKNNSIFPMRLSVAELPKDSNGKKRYIGSCQDLTQQQQQEELLRRSQKMDALGKLTGGIAHDYNNMLGVIIGYAELLKRSVKNEPKLLKYVDEIFRAGQRGAKLTNKLLSFSRNKSSDAKNININTLLHDEKHMLEKILTARINLQFELTENLWLVWLDFSDLEDAILNICINSMHAMKSTGTLTIKTQNRHIESIDAHLLQLKEGDYVELKITDTGSGMNEKTKENIFDPFFTTKGDQGTGLGLSQVYGFVKQNGGTIKVYTELWQGTELILYFPRSRNELSNDTNSNENNKIKEYRGSESILIVDDEQALLNLTSEILEKKGYTVFTANSGKQALNILKEKSIDLLLSDIIMSNMDGYQLSAIVQRKYPGIKIQLASGFNDDRHMNMVDKSLNDNMLNKPYNAEDLNKKIRKLLDS